MSDLISRSAVIKAMENNSFMVEVFGTKRKMIDGMMMCVEMADLPTIEAVPVVHGEWIKAENTWVCSVCHKENACAYDETLCRFTDFFCPKCGAKMKGGAE